MPKYSYTEFFQKFPKVYLEFSNIVDHSDHFYREFLDRGLFQNVKSMLSIGSGEGALEINVARKNGVRIGVVEPNSEYMRKFRAEFAKSLPESQKIEAVEGRFEDYSSSNRYDLVIAVHSWYALGCDETWILKAIDQLAPGGKLVIALVSQRNPVWKIGRLTGEDPAGGLSSERLSAWANERGLAHEYFANFRRVNRAVVFSSDGSLTRVGQSFACFPAFTPWEEFSADTASGAVGILRESVEGGELVLENGCLVFRRA